MNVASISNPPGECNVDFRRCLEVLRQEGHNEILIRCLDPSAFAHACREYFYRTQALIDQIKTMYDSLGDDRVVEWQVEPGLLRGMQNLPKHLKSLTAMADKKNRTEVVNAMGVGLIFPEGVANSSRRGGLSPNALFEMISGGEVVARVGKRDMGSLDRVRVHVVGDQPKTFTVPVAITKDHSAQPDE